MTAGGSRRAVVQRAVLVGCVLLIVVIQAILLQSYRSLDERSRAFVAGGSSVTTISSAQREMLLLQTSFEQYAAGARPEGLATRRSLTVNQVDLLARRDHTDGSPSAALVATVVEKLSRFDQDVARWNRRLSPQQAVHLRALLADAERAINGLYRLEETAFLRQANDAVLDARRTQMRLLALSPLTVLLGGATITMISRRSRRDVRRAYETLSREVELRRGAQEALEDSERRYRTLLHSGADLTLVVDPAGDLIHVTPASQRLLGRVPELLQGVPLTAILDEESVARYAETVRTVVGEAGGSQMIDLKAIHVDGTTRDLETTITDLSHDPDVGGVVLHARDATRRRSLEMQLRHAQKLESVGRLAAGVAHELNTPIQFIGDNLQFVEGAVNDLLEGSTPGPDVDGELAFLRAEIPQALAQSREGIDNVARIVRAMKVFGHPTGEEKELVDLGEAIRTTAIMARNELKYVADVALEIPDDLPSVMAHPGDLNQVVLNLLVNAAHAIGDVAEERGRGLITVTAGLQGDEVHIDVQDTGTGIHPSDAQRVFDPFFTTKEVGRGTGQGLTLSRSLVVDRHGGTLDFTTELGVGSTFRITLPLTAGVAATAPMGSCS